VLPEEKEEKRKNEGKKKIKEKDRRKLLSSKLRV